MAKPKNIETEAPALPNALVRIENKTKKGIDLIASGEFESRTLIPGGNNVPLAHLQSFQADFKAGRALGMRWYFDNRWLVVRMDGENEPEGPKAPASLMGYPAFVGEGSEKTEGPALVFVRLETNKDTLQRWLANEERSEVSEAISKRLATVKARG